MRSRTVEGMFANWRRKRAVAKVKPGDGHALPRYRWWQPLTRTLFYLPLTAEDGTQQTWSVDVRLWGDDDGVVQADLFLDGAHHARSTVPASFPVPGGTIEVATSNYGLKRCHYVREDGVTRQLSPEPASAEGRRARMEQNHSGLSKAIGALSILILLAALLLGLPQLVEQITHIPPIAERVGTFTSPIRLPGWVNITLTVAALLASIERALRLRNHWLLDGGSFDGED